ncbi:NEK, Kinase [Giardia lamblia P15]|uniref:NEK, Kinase n=1 Tax=Giardia intestinalis (strain P15) TaxID=658858 RepID=E1F9D6_GIAIA|nr:NEK, Kinase [Giardia lamblia P15]
MTGSGGHTSPPAAAPNIPQFALRDLHERLDGVIGRDFTGIVYSLRGYQGLAVKEISLDGLDRDGADTIKAKLTVILTLFHPGILRYHQVVEDEGLIYIVTDRHDKTLERLLIEHRRRKSPVSVAVTLSIARQLAAALAYLHSVSGVDAKGNPFRGLVHRDLKLANILISGDGEHFVIADFGLCKDALRSRSTIAGTAAYRAPEVLLRSEASPASDVWGLGVILYELVTLRRPNFLEGREPAEVFVDGWRPDLSGVADGFIKGILERILVLEPEKRLTAIELCGMLTTLDVSADELGHRYVVLEGRCSSLETALNSANARITALEAALDARSAEVASLKEDLEAKADRIDALEHQGKEHLAMIKALESRLAQSSSGMNAADPRSGLLLLPRLIHAAHTNSTEAVRVLLEEGTRTGQRDEQGMTALMHAARQGHLGPVKLLAEKEKGLQDRNGWTALMHATHGNHFKVVEILAPHEYGKRNNSGHTALMIAAEKGCAETASLLAPHEKGLADSRGSTALMIAVANSHAETARAIAAHEHGSRDPRGRTALMIAAQQGSLEVVGALVEHERGLKDDSGCTALAHAARAGHRGVAELLMAHEKDAAGWTVLMCAAALGDTDLASRHLSERGQRDRRGLTALVLAAQNGRGEAVELLAKHEGGVSGWTGLIHSAYLGDAGAVRSSLHEKGRQDVAGMTALMWAAHQGHKRAVKILLEHEKGMRDKDGNTAFMYALRNKHTDIAALLHEHEAPSWTPLMCASFTGDIEAVRMHLSDKDKKNSEGDTALIIAARAGHEAIVELLDPTDKDGVTALMRAADRNDLATVRELAPLQAGRRMSGDVTINGWTIYSGTALMRAAARDYIEVVRLLVKKEGGMQDMYGQSALMSTARNGYSDCVRLLVEKEGGMKKSDMWRNYEQTALVLAAQNGHSKCVRLLLEKEGGMKTSNGWSALIWATRNGHTDCARLLCKHKGERDVSDWTDLMYAACIGNANAVRNNLQKARIKSSDGRTALMLAAQNGHTDCARLLLEKEGGVKGSDGRTALMSAAEHDYLECVKLLLEKEGGIQSNDGLTALMYAALNGHPDCIELLLEKEGGMKDSGDQTALMKAVRNNQVECVKLLAERERGINRDKLLNIAIEMGNGEIMAILSK